MRTCVSLSLVVAMLLAVGCENARLSPREVVGQDITQYTYSLYDQPVATQAPARPVQLPARVALAQIGEVAAPLELLSALRKEPTLFNRVESIPGVTAAMPASPARTNPQPGGALNSFLAAEHMQKMQRFARDMGMDYLIVLGGTIDYDTQKSGLSLLDLTIVGAFIVPSRAIKGEAKASAAVVDLDTGRIVMVSSADADGTQFASAVSEDSGRLQLLKNLREKAVNRLGEQLIHDFTQRRPAQTDLSALN